MFAFAGLPSGPPLMALQAASSPAIKSAQLSEDDPLTFRERMARHEARAAHAEKNKELPALSIALSNVCGLSALVRYRLAEPVCVRAEALARQLGRPDLIAFAMGMRADAYAWLGQLERAKSLGLAALAENPPPDTQALAPRSLILEMLGVLAFETGHPDESFSYLAAAEAEASRAGWISHVGWINAGRGRLLSFVGDHAGARTQFALAAVLAEETGDLNLRVVIHWLTGLHEQGLGHLDVAIQEYDRCEEIGERISFTLIAASCVSEETDALILGGNLEEALRHVVLSERGLAAAGFPLTDALSVSRATIALRQGRYREAARQFDATLKLRPYIALDAWSGKARALAALGDLDGAISSLENAAAIVEKTRAVMSAGEMRSSYFEGRADVYRRLFGVVFDRDADRASGRLFEISESLRARSLVDRLAVAGLTPVEDSPDAPSTLAEAMARLETGDILLEYVESGDRLFALVVTGEGVHVVHLEGTGTAADLATRVGVFRDLVHSVETARHLLPAAKALFRDLVEPALSARDVQRPVLRLFIATDGPLGALPFEALADPSGEFLGASYPVIRVPSAAWLVRRGEPNIAAPKALVIANPIAGSALPGDVRGRFLRALPHAQVEARAIAGTWPDSVVLQGAQATEEATVSRLSEPFGGLHFATHAVEDPILPLRSSLRLSMGGNASRRDGLLTAGEIHQRAINIPLVVLAACDSAQGRFRSGEGDLSLVRAFLHAGATTVVGALFPADDQGSARFFDRFYQELSQGSTVESALMATRRHSIATLRPRVWAAFAMSGAPGLRFSPPTRLAFARTRVATAISLAVALLAVLVMWRRRIRRA